MAKRSLSSVPPPPVIIPDVAPPAAPPAAAEGAAAPPAPRVDVLKIEELMLLRVTRAMEKERAARAELQIASSNLNGLFHKWLRENDEARRAEGRIKELQDEQRAAEKSYHELIGIVGSELKIDMAKYAFDDESGVLTQLPTPAPPAPPQSTPPAAPPNTQPPLKE